MPEHNPAIHLERFNESHVEGITALYNDPAVTRDEFAPGRAFGVRRQRGGHRALPQVRLRK